MRSTGHLFSIQPRAQATQEIHVSWWHRKVTCFWISIITELPASRNAIGHPRPCPVSFRYFHCFGDNPFFFFLPHESPDAPYTNPTAPNNAPAPNHENF